MEENPFTALMGTIRRTATEVLPTGLGMGKVISWPSETAPTVPQRVLAGENTQDREDLLISAALKPYGLKAGDQVLLLPIEDAQRYIILCKVVAL